MKMLVLGALLALNGGSQAVQTASHIDLSRYAGKWFEVARFPNRFQKSCAGNVTATYTPKDANHLEVLNQCRKADGRIDSIHGTASVADTQTNATLHVSFFWPFYASYLILGVDPQYQWAVVGAPNRNYLWVLSRNAHLSPEQYRQALNVAKAQGFDTGLLVATPQQ